MNFWWLNSLQGEKYLQPNYIIMVTYSYIEWNKRIYTKIQRKSLRLDMFDEFKVCGKFREIAITMPAKMCIMFTTLTSL